MKLGLSDTDAETRRVHLDLMRSAPPWRKLELVDDLNRALRLLALSDLRRRFPDASEKELLRALADRLLGPELAARAYGPRSRRSE
jgi:hypothetical protein